MGGSVYILNKNTESLLVGSEEIGLDVNIDETKYVFMPADENSEGIYSINIGNKTFGWVEELKY